MKKYEYSPKDEGWTLTKRGGFGFWCALFHDKYHEAKKEYGGHFEKVRCTSCKVVYMSRIKAED